MFSYIKQFFKQISCNHLYVYKVKGENTYICRDCGARIGSLK